MAQEPAVVQVGVGIIARHPGTGRVLLGRRKSPHGKGKLSFPGGHLEHGESWSECAARELMEETNLSFVADPWLQATLNNVFLDSSKHYVTILMHGVIRDPEELVNLEPEKCESWFWIDEKEIEAWIKARSEEVFQPLINYYENKHKRDWEQGSVRPDEKYTLRYASTPC